MDQDIPIENWPENVMVKEENAYLAEEEADLEEETAGDVDVEHSQLDINETKCIDKFFSSACCILLCNSVIPNELIIQHRRRMQELNNNEKDLVILSAIHCHQRITELKDVYYERSKRVPRTGKYDSAEAAGSTSANRSHMKYFFAGLEVCKSFYLFANDIGTKQYLNLSKHHKEKGLVPREHKRKNVGRTWGKVITLSDTSHIVEFIKSYGDRYGVPSPVRVPKFKNFDVITLPSDVTKKSLWIEFCKVPDVKQVALSSFKTIWLKYCPYITVTKLSATSCDTVKNDTTKRKKKTMMLC